MMLVYDPSTNPLNNNEWAFPLAECVHIASMALSVGTISMVDLRLLGFGICNQTAAGLIRDTEIWTLSGFVLVIASGLLIFSSDPVQYMNNGPFRLKMGLVLLGITYNYTLRRRAARAESAVVARLAAVVSILMWVSIVFAAIFIAFA